MLEKSYTFELEQANDTVFSLVASPTFAQDGMCFAACSSGLYRSHDGGYNWESLSIADEYDHPLTTTAVMISPCFSTDGNVFAAVKGGILRSSDAGDTWFTTGFPAPPPLFSVLAVSPNFEFDGILLAGTMEDGVFASSDRGTHWKPWNFGLFDLNVLSIALSPNFTDDETVFAGTETGLFRSTNGGRAWRATEFPSEYAPILSLLVVNAGVNGKIMIFAGTENYGLFCSNDLGLTWSRLAEETILESVNEIKLNRKSDGSHILFALVEDRVLASDDYGQTWAQFIGIDDVPTALMIPNNTDNLLFVGLLDKGIMRLTNL